MGIEGLNTYSYIDNELSNNLDSRFAFEGPEKLLEIWFYPDAKSPPSHANLRSIGFEKWKCMLRLIKCEILSIKRTDHMDAFLLSESSMFIFNHKLTLKTCGTTTTLSCLQELIRLVKDELNWDFKLENGRHHPFKVFYSRRCFIFPARQDSIYRNWKDEVDYLDQFFFLGKSYLFGSKDSNDHWNLYVTRSNYSLLTSDDILEDETLEILMTGLDPKKAKQFVIDSKELEENGHKLGLNMTQCTKLDQIYDNISEYSFQQDSFAFKPCGYSSNMTLNGAYYYTLHVTPETGWSYASYESNVPIHMISRGSQRNSSVVNRVLKVFQPKEFRLIYFSKNLTKTDLADLLECISNYNTKDKIIHDLDEYQLLYLKCEFIESKN